jgi:hypothetical protein
MTELRRKTDRAEPVGDTATRVAVAAAVNDHRVLEFCLRRSPDLVDGAATLKIYEGFESAGAAYNAALDETTADYLVLVHQDVLLPEGAVASLKETLDDLSETDPSWAVAGVIGMDSAARVVGQTWSTSQGGLIGPPVEKPVKVETLDELILIVRTASNLRFDESLPLFHLYAADIIQIAKSAGYSSYVIPLMVVHFERRVVKLGDDYMRAYRYVQAKWSDRLPIPNLICPIVANPWRVRWQDFRLRKANGFARNRPEPSGDPAEIARSLARVRSS